MSDETHMARALEIAVAAAEAGEAPIGCVIVDETGAMIAEGANGPIASHDPGRCGGVRLWSQVQRVHGSTGGPLSAKGAASLGTWWDA